MGIEPTSPPCEGRNGFEDRGDHQVSSTPIMLLFDFSIMLCSPIYVY